MGSPPDLSRPGFLWVDFPTRPFDNRGMDREFFESAFRTGSRLTMRSLLKSGVRNDLTEEAVQAAWVRAWEYREQLRDEKFLMPWVISIARKIVDRANKESQRRRSLNGCRMLYENTSLDAAADVQTMICACNDDDRATLAQMLWGWTTHEVSRESGQASQTVARKRRRALQHVKELVSDSGQSPVRSRRSREFQDAFGRLRMQRPECFPLPFALDFVDHPPLFGHPMCGASA